MCLLESQAFGWEEWGRTLPRRVFSLPCSSLTAFCDHLALPSGVCKAVPSPAPRSAAYRCPVAVGEWPWQCPCPNRALAVPNLSTARPGTQVGVLARRAEISLQITGASMGTVRDGAGGNHREYPVLHFCGSEERWGGNLLLCLLL